MSTIWPVLIVLGILLFLLGDAFWILALIIVIGVILTLIICYPIIKRNKENLINSDMFQDEKQKIIDIVTMLKNSSYDSVVVTVTDFIYQPYGFDSLPRNVKASEESDNTIYIWVKKLVNMTAFEEYKKEPYSEFYKDLLCSHEFYKSGEELSAIIDRDYLISAFNDGVFQEEYGEMKVGFCIKYIVPDPLKGKNREILIDEIKKTSKDL